MHDALSLFLSNFSRNDSESLGIRECCTNLLH